MDDYLNNPFLWPHSHGFGTHGATGGEPIQDTQGMTVDDAGGEPIMGAGTT